jgi:Recombination endonuclease VII
MTDSKVCTTGAIRGILCGACNTAIGNLGDNVEGVTRALYYLQKSLNA